MVLQGAGGAAGQSRRGQLRQLRFMVGLRPPQGLQFGEISAEILQTGLVYMFTG